jgi:hypothetical protein
MKYLNISILALFFGAVTMSSCSKDEVISSSAIEPMEKQFVINNGLLYFDIPIDLAAPEGSEIENVIVETEDVLRNGVNFNVKIEYMITLNDKIVSIAISSDFAAAAGYNSVSFINDNYDVFVGHRNGVYKAQRGWLGRFFIGKVVNMGPCMGGSRAWVNDPWWGNPYGGGESPC